MFIDRKKTTFIFALLGIALLGSLIYYLATHGRIVIENIAGDSYSLAKVNDTDSTFGDVETVKNGALISSGTYALKNDQNGIERLAYVTVPRWLGTVSVTFKSNPSAQTSRIAALTYENLFTADNGSLVSYSALRNYAAGYTVHANDDAFGGDYVDKEFESNLVSPTPTSTGQLIGLSTGSLSRYSFVTQRLEPIRGVAINALRDGGESEEDITRIPKIQRSSDANSGMIGIYQKTKETLDVVDETGKATNYKIALKNERSLTFDINKNAWAIVETDTPINTTRPTSEESVHEEETLLEYKAITYDVSNKKTDELPLGTGVAVTEIALSPTGKYLAAIKDGRLWVYDTASKRAVFAHPFTLTNRIFWRGDSLYSLSSENGLSTLTPQTEQMLGVDIGIGSLSFSEMTPFGSKLYVTAYDPKNPSDLPDGYEIDLNKKNDGITARLASKLPYKGDEYEISYLRDTIYIRTNYFPLSNSPAEQQKLASIRKKAQDKVSELIGTSTLKKLTVRFAN